MDKRSGAFQAESAISDVCQIVASNVTNLGVSKSDLSHFVRDVRFESIVGQISTKSDQFGTLGLNVTSLHLVPI